MRSKKRLLSILLSVIMVIGLIPAGLIGASAADYKIWVGDIQVNSANAGDVLGNGSGSVKYDAATNTLTFKNRPNITKAYGNANVYYSDTKALTIKGAFKGTGAGYGIYAPGAALTLTNNTSGTETVSLESPQGAIYCIDLTVKGILVHAESSGATAIYAGNGNVTIDCPELIATSDGPRAIYARKQSAENSGNVYIKSGDVHANALNTGGEGIRADKNLEITGGTVTANGEGNAVNVGGNLFVKTGAVLNAVCTRTEDKIPSGGCGVHSYNSTGDVLVTGTLNAEGGRFSVHTHKLDIQGGTVNASKGMYGLFCGTDFVCNGGKVSSSGKEYGICAGGDCDISNGITELTAEGAIKAFRVTGALTIASSLGINDPAPGRQLDNRIVDGKDNDATYVEIGAPYTKYPVWVGDVRVTDKNLADVQGDGNKKVVYDPATKTLTLDMPTVTTATNGARIYVESGELTIAGAASLTGANYAVLSKEAKLTLKGEFELTGSQDGIVTQEDFGRLTIDGGKTVIKGDANGVCVYDGLDIINGANVKVTGSDGGVYVEQKDVEVRDSSLTAESDNGTAICAGTGTVRFERSTVIARGKYDGINATCYVTSEDSDITVEAIQGDGIYADMNDIRIKGGTVDVRSGQKNGVWAPKGDVNSVNAEVKVLAVGDALCGATVTLYGGTVDAEGEKNGVLAENSFKMNGGEVSVKGGYAGILLTGDFGDGVVLDGGTLTVSGGTNAAVNAMKTPVRIEYATVKADGAACGILSGADVTMKMADVAVTAKTDCGLLSENGKITVFGSKLDVTNGEGAAISAANGGVDLVSGSDVTATGTTTGISSKDKIAISGTIVSAKGGDAAIRTDDVIDLAADLYIITPKAGSVGSDKNTFLTPDGETAKEVVIDITPATYTVTFDSDGGSAVADQSVTQGLSAEEPAAPVREGFEFAGWFADSSKTEAYAFDTRVYDDITLYAKWNAPAGNYIVKFEVNGGSPVADQVVEENKTAEKPADPTREGYEFKGWFADEACAAAFDFAAPITADTTVYAKWEVTTGYYTVKFDVNGGSPVADQIVEENKTAEKPADPTRQGYEFKGWFADDACSEAFDFAAPVTADTTVYAKWEAPAGNYIVKFEVNGGSPVADQVVEENKTAEKPADPTREGYEFKGWFADDACSAAFDFASPITADTTVYAKWEVTAGYYTFKFEVNGGSPVADQVVEENKKADKPADPTREGFVFAGWFADDACSEAFDFAAPITANTTVYAKWEESAAPPAAMPGDVNLDGKVDATDARLALRAAAKLDTLEGQAFLNADIDGDGKIDATDARRILRAAAKLETLS
ncbi:MAG: InlB B-repeat-containing protein [Clostridiales bacterium]|nr:InlB B-repeat-containing protein [Clostridiales bacterium]